MGLEDMGGHAAFTKTVCSRDKQSSHFTGTFVQGFLFVDILALLTSSWTLVLTFLGAQGQVEGNDLLQHSAHLHAVFAGPNQPAEASNICFGWPQVDLWWRD